MMIRIWSCGHGDLLDFLLFMIFVIPLYGGRSRQKTCGVSSFSSKLVTGMFCWNYAVWMYFSDTCFFTKIWFDFIFFFFERFFAIAPKVAGYLFIMIRLLAVFFRVYFLRINFETTNFILISIFVLTFKFK